MVHVKLLHCFSLYCLSFGSSSKHHNQSNIHLKSELITGQLASKLVVMRKLPGSSWTVVFVLRTKVFAKTVRILKSSFRQPDWKFECRRRKHLTSLTNMSVDNCLHTKTPDISDKHVHRYKPAQEYTNVYRQRHLWQICPYIQTSTRIHNCLQTKTSLTNMSIDTNQHKNTQLSTDKDISDKHVHRYKPAQEYTTVYRWRHLWQTCPWTQRSTKHTQLFANRVWPSPAPGPECATVTGWPSACSPRSSPPAECCSSPRTCQQPLWSQSQ